MEKRKNGKRKVCCRSGALLLVVALWLCSCGRTGVEGKDSLADAQPVTIEETEETMTKQAAKESGLESAAGSQTENGNTEAGKTENGKTEVGKTEAGKTESGKAEAVKTESGKTETGKTESGKAEAGKTESGEAEAGKTESGKTESGKAEAGKTESGEAETGETESGKTETGRTETVKTETGDTAGTNADTSGTTVTEQQIPVSPNPPEVNQSGAEEEHNWQKVYWPSEPTCTCHGDYNIVCANCGAVKESGSDPAIPHTPVYQEICHGNCVTETIVAAVCSMCGLELGRECHYEADDHNWVEGTYEEFDWTLQKVVTKTIVQCSRCSATQ